MPSPASKPFFTAVEVSEHAHRLPAHLAAVARLSPDLTYDGIAAELNIPLGTVKSRLFRARVALRTIMDKETANARQGS